MIAISMLGLSYDSTVLKVVSSLEELRDTRVAVLQPTTQDCFWASRSPP